MCTLTDVSPGSCSRRLGSTPSCGAAACEFAVLRQNCCGLEALLQGTWKLQLQQAVSPHSSRIYWAPEVAAARKLAPSLLQFPLPPPSLPLNLSSWRTL